jgi:hypothetical protein
MVLDLASGRSSLRAATASGTSVVFVKLDDATVVATGEDFAILPNNCAALAAAAPSQLGKPTQTYLAAIEPSGGKSILFISSGTGHP